MQSLEPEEDARRLVRVVDAAVAESAFVAATAAAALQA
jgi:hypothetical protein